MEEGRGSLDDEVRVEVGLGAGPLHPGAVAGGERLDEEVPLWAHDQASLQIRGQGDWGSGWDCLRHRDIAVLESIGGQREGEGFGGRAT